MFLVDVGHVGRELELNLFFTHAIESTFLDYGTRLYGAGDEATGLSIVRQY